MRPIMFLGVLISLLAGGLGSPATGTEVYSAAVTDLSDAQSVLRAMRDKGAAELPAEALALYQEGLAAARMGNKTQAETALLAAGELDPSFPEPHLALAYLHLPGHPQTAVSDLGRAAVAATHSFGAQHLLLVNTVFGFFLIVAAGSLLVILYAAIKLLPRVHHTLTEILRRWMPAAPATFIAALLLVCPLLWRAGVVPAALFYGGLMWAWMDRGDRRWAVTLAGVCVAAPLVLWAFSPVFYSPLDPAGKPFLLSRAMAAPYSPGLAQAVNAAIEQDPQNADLHFARAMLEKRGGHLTAARKAYDDALRFGASEAAVANNLGVIAFHQGAYKEAMSLFQESIHSEGGRAAPHFNLSQAYAKELLFEKADQEMTEANRLAFNRIRAALRNAGGNWEGPLLDEPLPAGALWSAAWSGPRRMPGLSIWMQPWFPGSLALLPLIGLPLFGLGLGVGRRMHRSLPSFACTNCGRAVCRRCLRRIRRAAYCTTCGEALMRIQSAAYSKLVLDSRLRRTRKATSLLPKLIAWILPGYHASRLGHADLAAFLAMGASVATLGFAHQRLPVTRLAWLEDGHGPWWPALPLLLIALVYLASWFTVLKLTPAETETPATGREDKSSSTHGLPEGAGDLAA